MKQSPLVIDYYNDILCVWAWIAQKRVDTLHEQFGDRIELRHVYMDIFGNTHKKINTQWAERGAYEGFREHVLNAAADFDEAPVNPQIWQATRPSTSANAHMMIKAVESHYGEREANNFALATRKAFL